MAGNQNLHCVDIVTASAGTGKTHRLTSMIEDETVRGRKPENILATTFTVKAAEELRERIRTRLLAKGLTAQAVRLLGARLGTVNAVCGGLVGEFVLGLGLSPVAEIISDEAQTRIFRMAADEAIGRHASRLDELGRRLGHRDGKEPYDWRKDVNKVVDSARANDMASDRFAEFARRSVDGFSQLVRPPLAGETEASLNADLAQALNALLQHYPTNEGLSVKTGAALDQLRDIARANRIAELPWVEWARMSKSKDKKSNDSHYEPLRQAASAFARHPRLLSEVKDYIETIFACAAEAMQAYDAHKRRWGLIDFVDQERLALTLFRDEALRCSLSERIESVYVDEFQDTSPLQLALFVALSQIAERSAWVGDPKQAIYGFRGADPELIVRVAPKIMASTGGTPDALDTSYRSRKGIVEFVNDAFAETFLAMGLPDNAVRTEKFDRSDLPDQRVPLNVWHVEGGKIETRADTLAEGVRARLAQADEWRVEDHGKSRPLEPGDIAILCATNDRCDKLAGALVNVGLKVAIERGGLFGTPEVKLAFAALRWCADQRDNLALAEIANLLHSGEGQPEWFEAALEKDRSIAELAPLAVDLGEIARAGAHNSPREFFDAVLVAGGVSDAVRRWGESAERLKNLEAFRALVSAYEDECKRDRAPATSTGLCAWLAEQEGKQPASRASNAVTIVTYHRAKGLEWPMVVLSDLEREPKNSAFGLHVMSDRAPAEIDWRDPLAERWLRLWPWPFGPQKQDVTLDDRARDSGEGKEAARIEREERARVLYVGATRARDYLVLALSAKTGWGWLDELRAVDGAPAFMAPEAGTTTMLINGVEHPVCVATLLPTEPPEIESAYANYVSPQEEAPSFEPLALRPSDAEKDDGAKIADPINIGARLPFAGSPDMDKVGEALHRFLAADDPTFTPEQRLALATRLLKAWGVAGLDPRDVMTMGERFLAFVATRWPDGVLRREAPVAYRLGDRTLAGRIDVVVETSDEIIVIDHKSYPGGQTHWQALAEKYLGQLRLYGEALLVASNQPKRLRMALHLPISGQVLMVETGSS